MKCTLVLCMLLLRGIILELWMTHNKAGAYGVFSSFACYSAVSYAVMTKNTQLTMFIEDFVNVFTVVDCYGEWES